MIAPPPPPTAVASQGEPGAFSPTAAQNLWGAEVEIVPKRSFPDLFRAVIAGRARWGMVPVEDTLAGCLEELAGMALKLRVLGCYPGWTDRS